jgi:hypothetical protein
MSYSLTDIENGDTADADPLRACLESLRTTPLLNLIRDPHFRVWAAGDSAAPSYYTATAVAGSAVARETTIKHRDDATQNRGFVLKVTGGSAAAETVTQNVLGTAVFCAADVCAKTFTFAAAVRCASGSSARIGIYDGDTTTWSDYAAAGSTFVWCSVEKTLHASAATQLQIKLDSAQSIVSYFADLVMVEGALTLSETLTYPDCAAYWPDAPGTRQGDMAIATTINGWQGEAPLPAVVEAARFRAGTAPAGSVATFDVNKNGSTMFVTKPTIADGSNASGWKVPDPAAYASQCLAVGDYLSVDIDGVGSGTAGANLSTLIMATVWLHPYQHLIGALSEVG